MKPGESPNVLSEDEKIPDSKKDEQVSKYVQLPDFYITTSMWNFRLKLPTVCID